MKILYACSNREGAELQLFRFLQAVESKHYNIKIAAYKKTVVDIPIDWNLEALHNIFSPDFFDLENNNLQTYFEQVKHFNPDLIISDLEIFSSRVALALNIKLWQVSPLLIYYASSHSEKIKLGIYKTYGFLFDNIKLQQVIKNIIFDSDKRFIYSHFGDVGKLEVPKEYEWVRPFYLSGKISKASNHYLVAGLIKNNKKIINFINKYKDAVIFTNFLDEEYSDITLKNIYDNEEYGCNIRNCDYFVSAGHTDFIADAYYNRKFSYIMPNFNESECIINSLYSEYFNSGKIIYNQNNLEISNDVEFPTLNQDIKSLVEKIEEL